MTGSSVLQEPVRATVTSICDGKKGRYAVTTVDGASSITFALSTWKYDEEPSIGEIVNLFGVHQMRSGQRANSAGRITSA